MKQVKVKRLSDTVFDVFSGVEVVRIMDEGRVISIKMPTKEVLIPVANIDFLEEKEI